MTTTKEQGREIKELAEKITCNFDEDQHHAMLKLMEMIFEFAQQDWGLVENVMYDVREVVYPQTCHFTESLQRFLAEPPPSSDETIH